MPYRVTEIDQTYPVAGVDNESQGFRDNFSAIKDTLTQAKTDIESLQTTRLDTTDTISDLNNNTLENVNLKNASFEFFTAGGGTVADQDIDFTNGAYQVITCAKASPNISSPLVFTFTNFPENERYALIRVQVFGNNVQQFFDFASDGAGTFYYSDNWPTLSVTGILAPKIFEFWTYDAGQSVYARYLGEFTTD
jgi:hypothetical protein